MNETFLGAFSSIGPFTGDEAGFRSWVFTIAHRRLVDERRRISRRPDTGALYGEDTSPAMGDAEEEALDSLGDDRVRVLLDGLVPAQRHVLLLRIVGDLTVEQVATVLGKAAGAVKALQRRGLLALKKEILTRGVTL